MRFAAFLFAVALVVSSAFAVCPTTMTYQGIFTDLEGNVMPDGVYTIGFHIFPSPVGGPPVWSEWHDNVTVTNGVFEVILGTIFPLAFTDFFDPEGDGCWFSLEYNDTWMNPRQLINTVPYSLNTCMADSSTTTGSIGNITYDSLVVLAALYTARLDTLDFQIDSVRIGLIGENAGLTMNSNRSTDEPANGIDLLEDDTVAVGVPISVNLDVQSAMVITAAARLDHDIEACDADWYIVRIEVETQDEGEIVYSSMNLRIDGSSDIMMTAITPQLDPDDYLVRFYVMAVGGDCEVDEYEVAVTYEDIMHEPIMQSSRSQAQPRR